MKARGRIALLTLVVLVAVSAALAVNSVGAKPLSSNAGATDISFETVNLPPAADVLLNSWAPTTNYGSQGSLLVRSGDVAASLMQFDLSSLPQQQEIAVARAMLHLYVQSRTNAQTLQVAAYPVNRPWSAAQATWLQARAGDLWGQPGANATPADRGAQGTSPVTLSQVETWVTLDVTELVRAWINDPSSNQGLILKSFSGSSVGFNLASMDNINPALRPTLEVIYLIVPTPTATLPPSITPTAPPTSTPTSTPTPIPVISLSKTGPVGPLMDESYYNISYQIAVGNPGTEAVHSIVVTDVLPLGTDYLGSTGGVYDAETKMVTWEVGTLEGGESEQLTVNVRLSTWVEEDGNVINVAQADCDECPSVAESHWEIPVQVPTPTTAPTIDQPDVYTMFLVQMYHYRQQ